MLANPDRTILLSSLGWVEHDGLWRFDVENETVETMSFDTGARYVSLHCSGSDQFATAHHFEGKRFEIAIRNFVDPKTVHGSAVVDEHGETTLKGDLSIWSEVPQLYVEYLAFSPWNDFVLLKILPTEGKIEIQPLEWYDDSYDKDYQGVTEVIPIPNSSQVILSVQRSSQLIIQDLQTGKKIRSIELANRLGNLKLELRNVGKEIWAIDYDTLVVVQTESGKRLRSSRLQGSRGGTQEFVRDFSFTPDASLCAIARPFSGEVVAVDLDTLRIKSSVRLGQQPYEVMALAGGRVIARDWKSGALLKGTLERRWFTWLRGL